MWADSLRHALADLACGEPSEAVHDGVPGFDDGVHGVPRAVRLDLDLLVDVRAEVRGGLLPRTQALVFELAEKSFDEVGPWCGG